MSMRIISIIIFLLFSISLLAEEKGKKVEEKDASRIKPVPIVTDVTQKFIIKDKEYEIGEVLQYLIENNENIGQILYDAAKADSDYNKFQTKYSPVLLADGSVKKSEYPDDAVTSASGSEKDERLGRVSISKAFSTGTTITTGIQQTFADTADMNPAYGDEKYHNTSIFVKLEQELLKNVLGYQERRLENILKNKEKIIQELTLYNVSYMSLEAIVSAWQYALASSANLNADLKLKETKKVRSIVRGNVNLGLNESLYLNYWNSLVASNELQLANSVYSLKETRRDFLLKFNLDEAGITKQSMAVLSNRPPEIDVNIALDTAYKNRADYLKAKLALKNAQMSLEVYENEALPSLKAGVSVSTTGQRDQMNDAFNDSMEGKNQNYEATVRMTYPLANYEQQTNERDAAMAVEQARLELSKVRKVVKKDVLNSIDAIETAYTVYNKAHITRIESEKYYISLIRNLRKGRFSAADVKEALDGMVDSRQGELRALINYNAQLLLFDITQNVLFKKHGIDMAEVIKKKKKKIKS